MIIASAIKLIDGQVFVGKRHTHAWEAAMKILKTAAISVREDGFLTSKLEFLNREEAFIYAKANGQFKRIELAAEIGVTNTTNTEALFSEDLW